MSYTALIPFMSGQPQRGIEFRNAWGGAARIWDSLFEAYIPKKFQYDSWIISIKDDRLWKLSQRSDLPLFERSVHAFTFDLFYVRNEHLKSLSNDLRLFAQKYPSRGVDHLQAWAQWIDEHEQIEAVALYATSVSENMWFRPKQCDKCGSCDSGETEPVPLSSGTEVYDWLESLRCNTD